MIPAPLLAWTWLPLDTWIVVTGGLAAASCGLLGCYLVLRRLSMMGDAISHAVLPGLAAAFLAAIWLKSQVASLAAAPAWLAWLADVDPRAGPIMLIGATCAGLLTAFFTEWIQGAAGVERGAAMGVVFTVLFALGLILIRRAADSIDLDPDCVLNGNLELAAAHTIGLWGWQVPRAAAINAALLAVNLLVVALLYKEFKISAFDPALATSLGISARRMHYLLMTLASITAVAAFESVGSILVIAMLIVPAATARLLTDRLSRTLLLSVLIAVASAALGHVAALIVPTWLGFPGGSANTAGMIGVVAGGLFFAAALFAPQHGVVSRALARAKLRVRIAADDLLGALYRAEESGADRARRDPRLLMPAWVARMARWLLQRRGLALRVDGRLVLTLAGRESAAALVRSHRLWEAYLDEHLQLPADHLHSPAERLEHVTDAAIQARLAESTGDPARDPHGALIPPAKPAAK